MKFNFDVEIQETNTARITIEAENEEEAKAMLAKREFDWHSDVWFGDCTDVSLRVYAINDQEV